MLYKDKGCSLYTRPMINDGPMELVRNIFKTYSILALDEEKFFKDSINNIIELKKKLHKDTILILKGCLNTMSRNRRREYRVYLLTLMSIT